MKKRFLALLLAMVMIVSMVPVQAIAEEADETPELLEEAVVEEIVAEETEEIVPETTEEIVPETTEEIIPETTEETVPEVTEALIPEEAAVIPEGSDNLAPEGEVEEPSFNITFPSSARVIEENIEGNDVKIVVMTAGQKLNLSTSLSKADAKKGIKWAIVDGEALGTGEPVSALSLDEIRPEGAAVPRFPLS